MSASYALKDPDGGDAGSDAPQQAGGKPDQADRNRGKFAPGNSLARNANPAGRPKGFAGFARMIQEKTGGGQALLDFAWEVFTDEKKPHEWRWKALEYLTERGYGKAMQPLELHASVQKEMGVQNQRLPVDRLSPEELEVLDRLMRKMKGGSEPEGGAAPLQARMLPGPVVDAVVEPAPQPEAVQQESGRDLDAAEGE